MVHPIQEMESVVATVSGYHGLERFNLIRLIDHAGANYTGAMSSSNTHLVEECIKQGKRVSELPYTLQSGLEVGPLLLEVPPIHAGITRKSKLLSDHSNVRNHRGKEINYTGQGGSSNSVWTDSCLLKENLFPNAGKSNEKFQKSRRKSARNHID